MVPTLVMVNRNLTRRTLLLFRVLQETDLLVASGKSRKQGMKVVNLGIARFHFQLSWLKVHLISNPVSYS